MTDVGTAATLQMAETPMSYEARRSARELRTRIVIRLDRVEDVVPPDAEDDAVYLYFHRRHPSHHRRTAPQRFGSVAYELLCATSGDSRCSAPPPM